MFVGKKINQSQSENPHSQKSNAVYKMISGIYKGQQITNLRKVMQHTHKVCVFWYLKNNNTKQPSEKPCFIHLR